MKTNRNTRTYLIGRSVRTVKRVLAEEKNTGTLRPPKVPQREDLLILEEHQKYLIRRTVHKTWVNSGHVRSKIWVDQNVMSKRELFNQDLSAGLKNPSGRGKRLIVVHIGNEKGFVNKGLLFLKELNVEIITPR
jgi:hypothetical protein